MTKKGIEEQLEEQIEKLNKKLNIIKVLRECGVNKADAEKFINNIPTIYSGYSMGEYVKVDLITKDIRGVLFSYGNYSYYAKSCRWKATYGEVRVSIKTKKALNEFVKACNAQDIDKVKELVLANLTNDSKICNNDLRKIRVIF